MYLIRRRPPTRPEQKNEKDAHPPIGRVSQIGRVGARPALSVVLVPLNYATIRLHSGALKEKFRVAARDFRRLVGRPGVVRCS